MAKVKEGANSSTLTLDELLRTRSRTHDRAEINIYGQKYGFCTGCKTDYGTMILEYDEVFEYTDHHTDHLRHVDNGEYTDPDIISTLRLKVDVNSNYLTHGVDSVNSLNITVEQRAKNSVYSNSLAGNTLRERSKYTRLYNIL